MNDYKHNLICNAPICAGDPNSDFKKDVLWYAGEEICQRTPYEKFQKKQVAINKEVASGHFRQLEVPYNAFDLEHRSI